MDINQFILDNRLYVAIAIISIILLISMIYLIKH